MKFFSFRSLSFCLHCSTDFQLKLCSISLVNFSLFMMVVTRAKILQQLKLCSNKRDNEEVQLYDKDSLWV